jgi:hypothetical protein
MKNSLARKAANERSKSGSSSFACSGNVSIVGVSREAALAQGGLEPSSVARLGIGPACRSGVTMIRLPLIDRPLSSNRPRSWIRTPGISPLSESNGSEYAHSIHLVTLSRELVRGRTIPL